MFEESAIQVDVISPTGEITTELPNNAMDDNENIAGCGEFVETDTAYTGDVMESDGTYYLQFVQGTDSPILFGSLNYDVTVTRNRTTSDADGEQPPGSGDADSDTDTDRLSDDRERELSTSPRVADTNGDGLTSA